MKDKVIWQEKLKTISPKAKVNNENNSIFKLLKIMHNFFYKFI